MSAPGSHHWSQKLRIQRRQWRSVVEPSEGWSGIECILRLHYTEGNLPYCEPNWEYFLWESEANDLKSLYHYIIRDSCFSTFQIVIKSCICMISFCGVVALRQRLHFWNVRYYRIWLTCWLLPELLMELTLCILCSLLASRNLSDWSLFRPSFLPVGEVGEIPFSGCDCVWSSGISPGNFRLSFLVRHWNPFSQIRYF